MATKEMELFDIPMIIMGRSYDHFLSVNIEILASESYHIGFEECDFSKVAELERAIIHSIGEADKLKTFFFINCNLPDDFLTVIGDIFSKNRLFNMVAVSSAYEIILDIGSLYRSPLYHTYHHLLKRDVSVAERELEKGNEFLITSAPAPKAIVSQKPEGKIRTRNKGKCVIS